MKIFVYCVWKLVFDFILRSPLSIIRYLICKMFFCSIDRTSYIGRNCDIRMPQSISIGSCSVVNKNCILDGRGGTILIGSNVDIAQDCNIWTCEHNPNDDGHATRSADVIIDDYVWIASRVTILPGVRINKGAVVACGAVVTSDVQENTIVGGIPAKIIGYRQNKLQYRLEKPFWLQ